MTQTPRADPSMPGYLPEKDYQLKELVAAALAETLQVAAPEIVGRRVPGVLSVEVKPVDRFVVQVRVRADHGRPRGQMYHYYQLRVSEPQ